MPKNIWKIAKTIWKMPKTIWKMQKNIWKNAKQACRCASSHASLRRPALPSPLVGLMALDKLSASSFAMPGPGERFWELRRPKNRQSNRHFLRFSTVFLRFSTVVLRFSTVFLRFPLVLMHMFLFLLFCLLCLLCPLSWSHYAYDIDHVMPIIHIIMII